MKIGLCFFPKVGGSGIAATQLAIEFAKKGHEVVIFTYDTPFLLRQSRHENIKLMLIDLVSYPLFKDIGYPYTISSASKFVEVITKEKLDVLNVHYAIPAGVSAYLAKEITGIPVGITAHGSDIHILGIDPAYNSVMSHVFKKTDGISTVSKYMKKEIFKNFLEDNNKIHVIYNPIDTERFKNQEVIQCDFKKLYNNYFIHVSNFRKVKNAPFIVEAFSEVVKENNDVGLIMVGEGPERKDCEIIAKNLGIEEHVLFQGVRYNLTPLYSCSSALISASENESFGLTLAEAMACETPVIASRVGGIPEVVKDRETGLLYDYGNKEQLVKHMFTLLENKELAKKMGLKGRKRVLENFRFDKIADQYIKWYETLIKR
ncbi:MAG: N-acetyl-alpha-D-glucosaminyl L-malate synthase BshA [Candidatus Heimdallarchaeum endolithica]|uniref:N-acetyl-alpha-D-glucosaminyl L-malate synthase BshA n=1 Tax=Candidatus Heimdallarchaeum endolithica TaxID=2876572 RepID=A0A9Y1BTQ8_9ARCH|nr:MAG: N-acetyl-alpha-D-glucosaminyl L-malate synthase BshA [Candidatus Heimdallarchaeum endolithica]